MGFVALGVATVVMLAAFLLGLHVAASLGLLGLSLMSVFGDRPLWDLAGLVAWNTNTSFVLVATPPSTHAEITLHFLERVACGGAPRQPSRPAHRRARPSSRPCVPSARRSSLRIIGPAWTSSPCRKFTEVSSPVTWSAASRFRSRAATASPSSARKVSALDAAARGHHLSGSGNGLGSGDERDSPTRQLTTR